MACSTQECSSKFVLLPLGNTEATRQREYGVGLQRKCHVNVAGSLGNAARSAKTVGWRLTSRSTRSYSGFGVGVASSRTIITIDVSSVTRDRASVAVTTSTETANAPREKDLAGARSRGRSSRPVTERMCACIRK